MLDEKHGFVWCFGASLAPLLPVIEINREFTEFFNDPKREPTIHDDSGGHGVGWDAEIQIETLAQLRPRAICMNVTKITRTYDGER